ncbi:MAG: hypothetical protein OXM01_01730 [Gemmatimonadota bacterium]|nr:hypothetical protein [Gemmatimonadota bacterium]
MERFLQLFGHFVQFSYACWDRIVLRGYYPRLQRPENIVHFFREVCGDARITPAVLARRTATYRRWLESYTEQHRIPLLTAPKGVRKEEVVAPYYRSFKPDAGVVVILKSMEQSSTFISYEPRHAPPSGDDYRLIKRAPKRFLHYYFYVLDPVMGAMSLCVASYLPFSVNCFMNGHSYVAGELRRAGVAFRREDNAIVRCTDPALLAAIADRLDERILQQRANFWASRLAPRFSARERAACQLHYQWSVAQIEFARDVIFQRRARLRDLFQRAVEIGVALGGATQTRHIFGRHINRRYRGKLETVLERRAEGFPVLRGYYKSSYVKQYEKGNLLLRTETCLNDTYHLDIGRKLANLPALKQRLAATTDRYLEQQAELLDSTIDTGALAKLAAPVMVGSRRVPGIKLHDDRVIRLLDSLLYTGGLLGNWTTRELHERVLARHRLTEQDYTLSQLRYDLGKLRAHSLARRVGTSRRYRLTADGVRLGALLVKIRTRLLGPIFAAPSNATAPRSNHPSTVEAALRGVDHALDNLCHTLGLTAA